MPENKKPNTAAILSPRLRSDMVQKLNPETAAMIAWGKNASRQAADACEHGAGGSAQHERRGVAQMEGWGGRKSEGCSGPLRPRANLVLFSQEFENDGPVSSDNFRGRHDQSLTAPGVGGDAGGGCVIEVDCGEMVIVEDAGDDEADGRNRCLVAMLRQDVSTKRDSGN